jgi:RNA methyltransferase, TrmH family
MPPTITSSANPKIQRVRALLEKRKIREEEQAFVVEGVRLTEEALASHWQAELVLFTDQLSERGKEVVSGFEQSGAEVVEIPTRLMEQVAGTETPQGLLAVIHRQAQSLPEALNFVLIADTLRDPGNLGTLLRTAAAAGVQAAFVSPGAADAFSPKVLRAAMGAHFRLPVMPMEWGDIRARCKEQARPSLTIYRAEADEGDVCWNYDLRGPLALMVGGEAEGSSPQARALADRAIRIPMPGGSESLNAAAAGSILLFEVVRQRT